MDGHIQKNRIIQCCYNTSATAPSSTLPHARHSSQSTGADKCPTSGRTHMYIHTYVYHIYGYVVAVVVAVVVVIVVVVTTAAVFFPKLRLLLQL